MNELKKKQIEIARMIVKQGNCDGIYCRQYCWPPSYEPNCPLLDTYCQGMSGKAVEAAKEYLKKHSKTSKKELLERVEKLEEKVDVMEKTSESNECQGVTNARKLKHKLEQDILDLVSEYEEKTGLKVNNINLKTGPFLEVNIPAGRRERAMELERLPEVQARHKIRVTVNL